MKDKMIDINFDFTIDTPRFWDNYWLLDELLGSMNNDPDSSSKTLQLYHSLIYSKVLPNGEKMTLKCGNGANYLTWRNYRFGSDSITASFRYKKYRWMIEKASKTIPDYQKFMEEYLHKCYTLGGEIIFPKRQGGINQSRGCNPLIKDRFDLTLECIRRFYLGEFSPLYQVLLVDKNFFDLFVDFKGFVDFFYLQDCVSKDYSSVKFWIKDGTFEKNPLPETVEEYICWINVQLKIVENRNKRIQKDIKKREVLL